MVKALLFDLSYTLLFPKDQTYTAELNGLYKQLNVRCPEYDFNNHFYLNSKLLEFLATIKNRFELYMFTSGTIQNDPAINNKLNAIFNNIYSAEVLKLSKRDTESYHTISELIRHEPSEVLFIDDSIANITAADEAGMQTLQYKDYASTMKRITGLAISNS